MPIIRSDVCRAADDYFLTSSSFQIFPVCPFYIKGLVNWKIMVTRCQLSIRRIQLTAARQMELGTEHSIS